MTYAEAAVAVRGLLFKCVVEGYQARFARVVVMEEGVGWVVGYVSAKPTVDVDGERGSEREGERVGEKGVRENICVEVLGIG